MNSKEMQRWATVAAGGLMAAAGAKKGGRNGLLLSLAGGALALFGATRLGHEQSRTVFDEPRPNRWKVPRDRIAEDAKAFSRTGKAGKDLVHEASEESFPASDSPAYTPTTSIGGHEQQ